MAFTPIKFLKYSSDLVIGNMPNKFNYDNANITPAGMIPLGTVVFRAKGLDEAAAWAAVSKDADIVGTNEFAVVWGDHQGFAYDFTPRAIKAKFFNAIVLKRGPAELKEFYIKAVHGTQLTTKFDVLKQLMADQGVVVHDDVTKFLGTI